MTRKQFEDAVIEQWCQDDMPPDGLMRAAETVAARHPDTQRFVRAMKLELQR